MWSNLTICSYFMWRFKIFIFIFANFNVSFFRNIFHGNILLDVVFERYQIYQILLNAKKVMMAWNISAMYKKSYFRKIFGFYLLDQMNNWNVYKKPTCRTISLCNTLTTLPLPPFGNKLNLTQRQTFDWFWSMRKIWICGLGTISLTL